MNADDDEVKPALQFLQLRNDELPLVLCMDWDRPHAGHRYFLNGSSTHSLADIQSKDLKGSSVVQFADEYFAGKVKPQQKSHGQAESANAQEKVGVVCVCGHWV
jgi:hypothetical protein